MAMINAALPEGKKLEIASSVKTEINNADCYRGIVVFTYDDGLKNNFTNAVPLHLEYSIPATFALIADRVSNP